MNPPNDATCRTTQKELAELRQDMENLFSCTDAGIIFLDRNMRIRKFSPRIAEAFGLRDQDIGREISSYAQRIQHPQLMADLQAVAQDGMPREAEVRDISGRCYRLRFSPCLVDRKQDGIVLSMVDISMLAEARTHISRLSAIVKSSRDAIIGTDLRGIVTSWNAGAERLYGYSAVETIGRSISLIVPEEHLAVVESWMGRIQRGEIIDPVRVERITKSGSRVYVSVMISPIKNSLGEVVGASAIDRDITELAKARLAKEAGERQLRLLLESTAEAIYGVNTEGNCTFVNPACLRMLGYEKDVELLGKNMHELIHHSHIDGSHYPIEECCIYQAYQKGEPVHVEDDVFWRKDGSSFDVEYWSHPMTDERGTVGAVVTFLDTSERRDTANKLRQEIERREQFLAMLSHELRNPLSAVRTAVTLLNSREIDEENDQKSRLIIERQTAQMTRLLDDLLDVSRITQNKIRLSKTILDIRSVVEDAVQSIQSLSAEDDVEVYINIPEEPLMVLGDSARLQQIQTNLLANAIKYSSAGQRVLMSLDREADFAVIRVLDDGAGIAQEQLEKIFDIFIQSEVTLDRSHGGMGVGLTLVRELVELHGGTVVARSDGPGKGSEFEVRLPLVADTAATNASAVPAPHIRTNPQASIDRVVVIEDQDDNREMLVMVLELAGMTVSSAACGREGLSLIEREKPDAAVVDIGLPEIDGYEVARRIRAAESLDQANEKRGMKLIALTGYGQPQDIQRALDAGFDHHLVKPLQLEKLVEVLGHAPAAKVR